MGVSTTSGFTISVLASGGHTKSGGNGLGQEHHPHRKPAPTAPDPQIKLHFDLADCLDI